MRNFDDLVEEISGRGRAINDALGPLRRETRVMVGVEVGEEVRDGEIGVGVFEAVDDEAGFWNEFGVGERGGGRDERESGLGLWWQGKGGEGGAVERGGGYI